MSFHKSSATGMFVAFTLCGAAPAFALLVQPISIAMQATGAQSNAAITVVNDRDRENKFEVTVNKLTLPENGPPVLTPTKGEEFLIFPPVAAVQAGKTQVVRIRWVGDSALKQTQAYMFNTAELPVKQALGTGVQIVYSIQSLVLVSSPTLKPDISAAVGQDAREEEPATEDHPARTVPGMSVTISNAGNGADFLTNYNFGLKSGAWSLAIDSHDVGRYVGLGLVMPHSKRHFFLAIPGLPNGPIQVALQHVAN